MPSPEGSVWQHFKFTHFLAKNDILPNNGQSDSCESKVRLYIGHFFFINKIWSKYPFIWYIGFLHILLIFWWKLGLKVGNFCTFFIRKKIKCEKTLNFEIPIYKHTNVIFSKITFWVFINLYKGLISPIWVKSADPTYHLLVKTGDS